MPAPTGSSDDWWGARLAERGAEALAAVRSALRVAAAPRPEPPLARRRKPADYVDGDDPSVRAHWAVLVAGSNGWGNYRHQADVFHAYQVNGGGFCRCL